MESFVFSATTQCVLSFFDQINRFPRCSGNEIALANWMLQWANKEGFSSYKDTAGNVIIHVPATKGYENIPPVILQGHLDMVCEKTPESSHNFSADPIINIIDGDWLHAKDTSLGADNGLAIAIIMALVTTSEIEHGPIEILLTVEEETGMRGASELIADSLHGRFLLNLDSEDEGVFTIGCAGGQDTRFQLSLTIENTTIQHEALQIKVQNLRGGHSGIDIHQGSANAILLVARFLQQLSKTEKIQLVAFEGGSAKNAIPRDCMAIITGSKEAIFAALKFASAYQDKIQAQFKKTDPYLSFSASKTDPSSHHVPAEKTRTILSFVNEIPHGAISMCVDMPQTVETSTNLAVVSLTTTHLDIWTSQRSCVPKKLSELVDSIQQIGQKYRAHISSQHKYPPWTPNFKSSLLALCTDTYRSLFGREASIKTIHAGLECSILGEKLQGLDMISFGPTLKHAHSPNECLQISSIDAVFQFLKELLKSFKKMV